jgi:dienelactone hydrolase
MSPSDANGPALSVPVDAPLLDEEIPIRARGLDAGERVTLRAEMTWDGTPLTASARFDATDEGVVSTAEQSPVDGAYDGLRPMGLFWAMQPPEDASVDRDRLPERLPTTVTLERGGEPVASASIQRRTRADGVRRHEVDADGLPADLYLPPGDGPHPGVVFLGGSDGGRPRGARPWLLASHGYAVLGPAYFGEDGAPVSELAEVPVKAVERAVAWFADREGVAADPLGVVGVSRGSELAFLLGGRLDAVRAVVGYVPSGVAFEGLGENFQRTETAAWAVDGDPVAHVPMSFTLRDVLGSAWNFLRGRATALRGAYVEGLEAADPERVAAAELPVEQVGGPVLLLGAGDDRLWASDAFARRLRDRLDAAGDDHDVDCRVFPDAGHAIAAPYLPATNRSVAGEGRFQLRLGGTPAGYAAADEAAWSAVLETLGEAVGPPGRRD